MSIYATLWSMKFEHPEYWDEWLEVTAQGVPNHIDMECDWLPPPIPEDPTSTRMRAVVLVADDDTKGTERSGQEYRAPLLVLSGEEYESIGWKEMLDRVWGAMEKRRAEAGDTEEAPKKVTERSTPSCSHCGGATEPGYICVSCEVAATDELESVREHRAALDAILVLCRPDLVNERGHLPAECLNDPKFGETVQQAVAHLRSEFDAVNRSHVEDVELRCDIEEKYENLRQQYSAALDVSSAIHNLGRRLGIPWTNPQNTLDVIAEIEKRYNERKVPKP